MSAVATFVTTRRKPRSNSSSVPQHIVRIGYNTTLFVTIDMRDQQSRLFHPSRPHCALHLRAADHSVAVPIRSVRMILVGVATFDVDYLLGPEKVCVVAPGGLRRVLHVELPAGSTGFPHATASVDDHTQR